MMSILFVMTKLVDVQVARSAPAAVFNCKKKKV